MAQKFNAIIDFSTNILTLTEGVDILGGEKLYFKITEPETGATMHTNDAFSVPPNHDSPDITEGNADSVEIDMPEDSDGNIIEGTYAITYVSEVSGKFSTFYATFIYCVEAPTVVISQTYSCLNSTLTSSDITDYGLKTTCGSGAAIEPDVQYTQRVHTIKYPTTLEIPIPDIDAAGQAVYTVTGIWTKIWTTLIETFLRYPMPSASYTGNMYYEVRGTVSNTRTINVLCNDCLCQMYVCIKQLFTQYMNEIGRNPELATRYESLLIRLNSLYMLYGIALNCGNADQLKDICAQIQAVINVVGCVCCDDEEDSGYSVEVIALGGGGSGFIAGTKWYSGVTPPLVTEGVNGDFYLDIVSYGVYKKVGGVWVLQFTMTFTGTVGNYLMESDNVEVSTHSDIYTELKSIEFDITDVKDGSVLVLSANLKYLVPTGENTAVRVDIVGVTTDSTSIFIDGDIDGISFMATLEIEYYIADVGGSLTIVGKIWKLTGETGILAYGQGVLNVVLNPTLTANSIDVLAKSYDNITEIYLANTRLNQLRTV